MRNLGFLLLAAIPAAALAQTPESDQRVMQTLLTEVQQLRMAIERQTLLSTRTQIALGQMQLQESRAAAVEKDLLAVRDQLGHEKQQRARFAGNLKNLEDKRSLGFATPQARDEAEDAIRQFKALQAESTATEERLAAREGDLASQFQAAQREVQESRNRIADMERALDAAIQQMLKPK